MIYRLGSWAAPDGVFALDAQAASLADIPIGNQDDPYYSRKKCSRAKSKHATIIVLTPAGSLYESFIDFLWKY
jgi:hypothetical protein